MKPIVIWLVDGHWGYGRNGGKHILAGWLRTPWPPNAKIVAMLVAFVFASCSRVAENSCLPPGLSFESAKRAYETRKYAEASRAFEALAVGAQRCAKDEPLDAGQREFVVNEMLTAAEAAHWDHHDARARTLLIRAHALIRQFEAISKNDNDVEFALLLDRDQAQRDLAGTWTLGVRQ